jgi:hypothetical protein
MTICLLLITTAAMADTTLVFVDGENIGTVQIKDGLLRASEKKNSHDYMLFDSKSKSMTVIDHKNKKYTRIDETDLKQLGGMVSEMQKQLEAQLKNLPPEQQAQMRQMMESMMPSGMGKENQTMRSEVTSQTSKVGDWACKIINIFKGDEKVSRICVADYKSLNIPEQDYQVIKELMVFVAGISESFPMVERASFASADLGKGMLPVTVESLQQSGNERSMTLSMVDTKSLDKSLFTVPADYTEEDMMQ